MNHQEARDNPTRDQLILADETLRVIVSVLPYSPLCTEFARARDPMDGGHISTADVSAIERELNHAEDDPCTIVTRLALRNAATDLRRALRHIDLDALEHRGRTVSVFVLDPDRDDIESIKAALA